MHGLTSRPGALLLPSILPSPSYFRPSRFSLCLFLLPPLPPFPWAPPAADARRRLLSVPHIRATSPRTVRLLQVPWSEGVIERTVERRLAAASEETIEGRSTAVAAVSDRTNGRATASGGERTDDPWSMAARERTIDGRVLAGVVAME